MCLPTVLCAVGKKGHLTTEVEQVSSRLREGPLHLT